MRAFMRQLHRCLLVCHPARSHVRHQQLNSEESETFSYKQERLTLFNRAKYHVDFIFFRFHDDSIGLKCQVTNKHVAPGAYRKGFQCLVKKFDLFNLSRCLLHIMTTQLVGKVHQTYSQYETVFRQNISRKTCTDETLYM